MEKDTHAALELLDSGDFTCAVCRDSVSYTTLQRGVRPLLDWLDSGIDLRGFCAADRVVGRATAYLYCLLGVKEVYARVMSQPAAEVLLKAGIPVHAGKMVDGIINRSGTGPCPFETAVMDIFTPEEALAAIRRKMAQM